MYDTVYAELDCPFCGRQYRFTPLTQEQAENEVEEYKQRQVESRRRYLQNEKEFLKLPGKLGMDWGVCVNPASPRAGLLTFEHQGCKQFEDDEIEMEEE